MDPGTHGFNHNRHKAVALVEVGLIELEILASAFVFLPEGVFTQLSLLEAQLSTADSLTNFS